jgi:hypothetical protein
MPFGKKWLDTLTTTFGSYGRSYADWTAWYVAHSFSAPIISHTVAPVSDGRLQLWAVDASGNLYTTWKTSRQPGSN